LSVLFMLKRKDECCDFWIFIYDENDKCFFLARNKPVEK